MLSPEPMRHLSAIVLADDVETAARTIADIGVLHLLDVREIGEAARTVEPYDTSEVRARLERLSDDLASISAQLRLSPPEPDQGFAPGERADPSALERRVEEIGRESESLRARLARAEDERTLLRNLRQTLAALTPLGLPLEDLRDLRYVHLVYGYLPARHLARLRESLSRTTSVVVPTDGEPRDGRLLIAALSLRRDGDVLDRALRAAQFERLEIPPRLEGTPDEGIARLDAELAAKDGDLASLEEERRGLAARLEPELTTLAALVARERLIAEARALMGHSERTALVAGWVPAVLADRLETQVRGAVGNRCVLEWTDPSRIEGVRSGRIPVPILLHNPVLIRPFERLLRAYGLPRYGEIEPTPILAVGFLTMFGFMFGDVGQGAVLAGVGYFMYRRMFRYRDYAVILMECGVFAAAFGFLYGSVFGVESWIPALWIRPLEDTATLIKTAIAFGIGFVSLGLLLNGVNAVRRKDWESLWERNGLLAALAYWFAVALLIRTWTEGPRGVVLGSAALWLALPAALILLKEPVRVLWRGVREGAWPGADDALAALVRAVVEVLDTFVATVSNTATFIRLAAFALSHAALLLATFSIADAIAHTAAGTPGAVVVMVLGNAVVIALEGVIVAIQSLRLEYYEFFSRFYSADGEEYRPLHVAPAPPRA